MTTSTTATATDNALVLRDALTDVRTVQQATDLFASMGFNPADDEADGIRSLEVVDKDALLGVPFLMLRWSWNTSDKFNGEFVSIECMKENGETVVINDGSTGIYDQLRTLTDHRMSTDHPSPNAGRMVRRGLRRSDYETTDAKGEPIKASTYYLAY